MKRKNILLGSVGIIATAAAFIFAPTGSEKGKYSQQDLSGFERKSAKESQEWLKARFTDHLTGQPMTKQRIEEISQAIALLPRAKSGGVTFVERGPDNIGGRTRAIQIDRTVPNRIWAGGVSGGLFRSDNGANNWQYIASYEGVGSPNISSMAQFSDGTLFVATGSLHEPGLFAGNGVWYTTDEGATWTIVPGTGSFDRVTEIFAPLNSTKLYLATPAGLKTWSPGDASLTSVSVGSSSTAACKAMSATEDGQIMIVAMTGSSKTHVSTDGGQTWTEKTSQTTTTFGRVEYAISHEANTSGNYSMYAVFVNTAGNFQKAYQSKDSGNTWTEILDGLGAGGGQQNDLFRGQGTYDLITSVVPGNPGKLLVGGIDIWRWEEYQSTGTLNKLTLWNASPTSSKYAHADQHEMKWDGNKLYIGNDGGVGITTNIDGSWYPANRGYNITQFYGIAVNKHGHLLGGTQDNGTLYNNYQNSNWNDFKEVNGGDGFQCAISFFNPQVMFSTLYYGSTFRSGDEGQNFERDPSTGRGFIPTSPVYVGGTHPFHTVIRLGEYFDANSKDSVQLVARQTATAGTVVPVPSRATGNTISHTLTTNIYFGDTVLYDSGLSDPSAISIVDSITNTNVYLGLYSWAHLGTSGSGGTPPAVGDSLTYTVNGVLDTVLVKSVGTFTNYFTTNPSTGQAYNMGLDSVLYNIPWDTIQVQDPYQSWYVIYSTLYNGSIWGTRDALDLTKVPYATLPENKTSWGVIAKNLGTGTGSPHYAVDMKFSKDLNHLFVSVGSGNVIRIDSLGSIYSSESDFATKAFYSGTTPPTGVTVNSFTVGGNIEGLAVNPNDANDLLVFRGTQTMMRSNGNAAGTATFSPIGNISGASSPAVFDGIIDREDPNVLVVGTSHGAFYSENGGTSWTDASEGFTGTPVFTVLQNWRTWGEGNFRPGEIYVGTYGRGIWASSAYLNTDEITPNSTEKTAFKASLKAFPNPASTSSTVEFELNYASDIQVKVYNLSGREMLSTERKNVAAGTNTIPLNIKNLAKGTYIVRLKAGKDQLTTKIIKF